MLFNLRTATAATLALFAAVPSLAALTPDEIITNIQVLTTKSLALQAPANSINLLNGPLIAIGLGPFPKIIVGFTDIVTTAGVAITQIQGSKPVTSHNHAVAIANAFREFVHVHQALLNILIGKAGLFSTAPFIGRPVAAVLRQIEGVVDTIAFALIGLVEAEAVSLTREQGNLDKTLTISITTYSDLSTRKARRGIDRS